MRNVQQILEDVKREWRSMDEIVRAVAAKFECVGEEVREGVEAVVGELVNQRFVEVKVALAGETTLGQSSTGETPVVPVNGQQFRKVRRLQGSRLLLGVHVPELQRDGRHVQARRALLQGGSDQP